MSENRKIAQKLFFDQALPEEIEIALDQAEGRAIRRCAEIPMEDHQVGDQLAATKRCNHMDMRDRILKLLPPSGTSEEKRGENMRTRRDIFFDALEDLFFRGNQAADKLDECDKTFTADILRGAIFAARKEFYSGSFKRLKKRGKKK